MTTDKRTVATDALDTLGTFPIPPDSGRDAIHLAVEPVVAGETLSAGQHVGLNDKGYAFSTGYKLIGIVDPFTNGNIHRYERFWLVVYPRQITSLRHVWEHPDFGDEKPRSTVPTVEDSQAWIVQYADENNIPVQKLLDGATKWLATYNDGYSGEYLNLGDILEGLSIPDAFWDHYAKVTGNKVPDEARISFFSCSC